jgi:hypothetical protein
MTGLRIGYALALVALLDVARVQGGEAWRQDAVKSAPAPLPYPADVRKFEVYPQSIVLTGGDDTRQLIVTATLRDGSQRDLTNDASYRIGDGKIARVTRAGRVMPAADGWTEVVASYGNQSVTVPVRAESVAVDLPINFANQVVPIFTKLGCNAGGCHGKASGQNGFKLSLLGFEPPADYDALVKEARGRRVFPAAPDHSLLLLKATGAVGHGGGKRIERDSDEYRLLRRWIASGMPVGEASDPAVTGISIYPDHRVLSRRSKQQIAVYAHYSDGSVADITRRAQYDSNDTEIAGVEPSGLVHTLALSGEAAVMARYQGHVAVFRATVPVGGSTPSYDFLAQTLVDRFTLKKWRELGLAPSELCSDEHFIRRVSIDVTGTLPTPAEVIAFVSDRRPDKRDRLVDELLERPEYAYYFATKWADILHVKRQQIPARAEGTFAFHDWIRSALAADKPYDEFVRDILTATGDESHFPPTVWYKEVHSPEQFVDDTAQVFLGLRLACAQCHHHPYEKWGQGDYWGFAAFFGRVGRKATPVPGGVLNQPARHFSIYNMDDGQVLDKRTGKPARIKPLDQPAIDVPAGDDPREKLVDWMVDVKNPFFARAVVNRYWAHFFGRGLVDPLDDMRVTNPPSNPELLDALARDLVAHRYSLKYLVRTICKSRTYGLSSVPNEVNKNDKQTYARYYPKRLSAEVLFDAVCQVTDSPAGFGGLPHDRHAPRRAIMLPDESFSSYFLDVFGRPQRSSACECERVSEANLAQALHLLNSDEIQAKLSHPGGRADQLARDPRPDAIKIEELFLWALAHRPTPDQLQLALAHISQNAKDKKGAYENILWALLNTKEFVFNQ